MPVAMTGMAFFFPPVVSTLILPLRYHAAWMAGMVVRCSLPPAPCCQFPELTIQEADGYNGYADHPCSDKNDNPE